MSRDSVLVMFYMRLEKHVGNATSSELLFALAVVGFDSRAIHIVCARAKMS